MSDEPKQTEVESRWQPVAVVSIRGDEPKKRPHPIRMVLFMIIGAAFAALYAPVRLKAFTGPAVELFCVVAGALGGAALEFLVRADRRDKNSRAKRSKP